MVLCKYFQQGNCRFGQYCRFEHQLPNKYNYYNANSQQQSTSILRQTSPPQGFGAPNLGSTNPAPAILDLNTLVKAVAADMTGAEKGGQWLLSFYSPFKEKAAFPGFEDYSPEEIRFGFYEARKNNTLDQYKQQLQQLVQTALAKVRALQNPSAEVISILQNIYYGQNANLQPAFATQNANVFKSPVQSATNIFAGSPPQNANNIFANEQIQQRQNVFAPSQMFGSSFGQSSNIFAKPPPPANNIFASQANSPPAYNNVQAQQHSTNIFGPSTQTANVFALSAQKPNSFTQNAHFGQPPVFANNQNNLFNKPVQQQQNVSIQASNTPLSQNVAPLNYSASVFGSPINVQSVDLSVYSKLEELTEAEKQWFASKEVTIYNIPENPPTYEMCFET